MIGPGASRNPNKDRYDYDHDGSPVKTDGVVPVNYRDHKIKQFCYMMAQTWTSQTMIELYLYQLMKDLGYTDLITMKVKYGKRIPKKPRGYNRVRSTIIDG